MKKILQLTFPKKQNKTKIVIEAGHIYTNEQPSLEHKIGATWGNLLSNYLELFGAEIKQWLFIDNYNPLFEDKPQDLSIENYVKELSQTGFIPDKIVYEADLINQAKEIINYLEKKNYAGKHKKDKTALYKGKVLLYDSEKDKYMCSLLDACLYLKKLEQADSCITILDKKYIHQQKGTLAILKKLDVEVNKIFPFFYSTKKTEHQGSISTHNIYANEQDKISFIQPAIDLLQTVSKLYGTVSPTDQLDMEVSKYGI